MENKKYKLTEETKTYSGRKLYRILALKNFGDVKKGDLGGFIANEDNLSFEDGDTSWIYDNSVVDNSVVINNSVVRDNSVVVNSVVDNSVVVNSVVDNSEVAYSEVVKSRVAYSEVVKSVVSNSEVDNSRVDNSEVINNSVVRDNSVVVKSRVCNSEVAYSRVDGGAKMYGANITNQGTWFLARNVGSENGTLTAYLNKDNAIGVTRGCFRGSLEEFKVAVIKKHKRANPKVFKQYMLLCDVIESSIDIPSKGG